MIQSKYTVIPCTILKLYVSVRRDPFFNCFTESHDGPLSFYTVEEIQEKRCDMFSKCTKITQNF